MKLAVAFFLCICFLVATGHAPTKAFPVGTGYSSVQEIEQIPQTKLTIPDRQLPVVSKYEAFVSIEDEDESPVFNRKYILLASYLIVFTNTSALAELYNTFKNRLQFCTHLSVTASYKYILQRVLRI